MEVDVTDGSSESMGPLSQSVMRICFGSPGEASVVDFVFAPLTRLLAW